MSTTNTINVPILIVGGGIAGLSVSLFLSHHGIHSMLVERHSSTSIHPRARSVNARTMEIFRSIGLSDLVRNAGASLAPSWGIYSGSTLKSVIEAKSRRQEETTTLKKRKLHGLLETGPEDGTFVTQDMLEPVLLEAVKRRGADVKFHTECIGLEQDQEKVTASIRDRDTGDISNVTAQYLIAADGVHSPIRSRLDVPTSGRGTMGFLLNILFHADLKSLVDGREFSLCVIDRPEVVGIFAAINNNDRWVFHLSYDPSKGEEPANFTPEKCKALLRIALGLPDIEIEIISVLPWQPSVRVATKFQHDRIFLIGDAAHQMPPYGGQGANSAISDAHNLAWKLSTVLKNQASPRFLETFDVERLPVGKAAAEISAAPADNRGLISVKLTLSTLLAFAKIFTVASGYGYVYSAESSAVVEESRWPLGGITWKTWSPPSLLFSLDGRPGSRAPHVWLEKEGKKISTVDLFGKGFILLAGSEGDAWIEASQEVKRDFQGLGFASYCVGPKADIIDKEKKWERAAGISSTGALLVRPDGFVAWRQRRMPAHITDTLKQIFREILCL